KLSAQVVLPPELHQSHYFCKSQDERHFAKAFSLDAHPFLKEITKACKQLQVVVPWSFFEKSGPHFYNSLAMIDATGDVLGVYRKSHIPDGPGYQEKFYFRPGNTGFMVFATKYGKLGAAICWDQWFPEAARIMTLKGADMLLYPTAIGSEPQNPNLCTKEAWLRVMKGHAVANMIPVGASNRVGEEDGQTFYGHSFICDELGDDLLALQQEEGVKVAVVDLNKARHHRASFGFFRDRRVDLYGELLS
ncbi:MAG TPA: nitrilase-related carbon-nitrogen hydrolase, partial [Myxococcota bacterium]|nr:nitrilase-related carbon-nitrogen hydrolase [Myxococcota bacterium]